MVKKKTVPPKVLKKATSTPKGLAGGAEKGGEPVRVAIDRFAVQLPLRDLFAAVAMNGVVSSTTSRGCDGFSLPNNDIIADIAYRMADEMLKAREKE